MSAALFAIAFAVLPLLAGGGASGLAREPLAARAPARACADAIDRVVEAAMKADDLPGLSLIVGHGGALVKQAAYGEADVERHLPATLETVYPIASATKTFTSSAIFLLVRAGKFSLEDSIVELLPDLPEAWLEVTVRHLLTHTSGLPDVAVSSGREPLIAATRAEALAKLGTMPLAFPVGTRWSYNQTNYMLLLMLVEKYGERT